MLPACVDSQPHAPRGCELEGFNRATDGEIVAAGSTFDAAGYRHFTAVRVGATGALDSGYGTGGWAIAPEIAYDGDDPQAMTLQPDGRLLVAGGAKPIANSNITDVGLVRFLPSAPQVGSFLANPNPVTSGSSTTLTASNITDGNPGASVTQVAFYVQLNGTTTLLGYGTQTSPGVWTFTYTVSLAPGSYTLLAQAQDSDGVFGDPLALTLTVQ